MDTVASVPALIRTDDSLMIRCVLPLVPLHTGFDGLVRLASVRFGWIADLGPPGPTEQREIGFRPWLFENAPHNMTHWRLRGMQ
jgi:hypothetical protein